MWDRRTVVFGPIHTQTPSNDEAGFEVASRETAEWLERTEG
jgi:hypothetical protein